jgi:aldehyde:ferredoxin oxidoreductase
MPRREVWEYPRGEDEVKMCGWAGKILRVDLTSGEVKKTPFSKAFARKWLGGRGFNMKALWDLVPRGVDPLGPDNVLCFGVGPLTGTLAASSGRHNVSAKSPLTGHLGDSNSGGHWGAELKMAGYDQIVFTGRAEEPKYLFVADEDVELRDAGHLWGKTTWETDDILKKEIGDPKIKIAYCGPAGENLVRMACVINERFRAAGRTGMGAVMGSKNLKAIAVRGTKGVEIARMEEFIEAIKKNYNWIANSSEADEYKLLGTPRLYNPRSTPWVNNYQSQEFPDLPNLYGTTLLQKHIVRRKGCFSCPVSCSRFYNVRDGSFKGTRGGGPEWETIAHLGPKCGNSNLESLLNMNNLCNQYGVDTITMGTSISCAMEWYQRGLITEEETGGLTLEWGDYQTIEELARMTFSREGIGDVLAEGPLRAAEKIGGEADKYVCHILGLAHADLRGRYLSIPGYLTSTRGCDHLRNHALNHIVLYKMVGELFGISEEEVEKYTANTTYGKDVFGVYGQHQWMLSDCMGRCKFPASRPPIYKSYPKLVSGATGWDVDYEGLLKIAERVYNLEQAFLVREGISRRDFKFPWRFNQPLLDGPNKGWQIKPGELDEMLDNYYLYRGWDQKTAVPTREKLEELGLEDVAEYLDDLKKKGMIGKHTEFIPWN